MSYINYSRGRATVYDPERKRHIALARRVLERRLGRQLRSDEIVHHINCLPWDDRAENLLLTDSPRHRRIHQAIRVRAAACGIALPTGRQRYLQFEQWARDAGLEQVNRSETWHYFRCPDLEAAS